MKISEQTRSSQILGYLTYGVLVGGCIITLAFFCLAFICDDNHSLAMFLAAFLSVVYTAVAWAEIKIFVELCDNVQVIRDYIIAISNNEKIDDTEEEEEY